MIKYCYCCCEQHDEKAVLPKVGGVEICSACGVDSIGHFKNIKELKDKHFNSFHCAVEFNQDGTSKEVIEKGTCPSCVDLKEDEIDFVARAKMMDDGTLCCRCGCEIYLEPCEYARLCGKCYEEVSE